MFEALRKENKEMKFTYEKINNIKPALTKLSKLDLRAVEAVKLARLLGKVESELKPLEETQRNMWIKYGEEVESGSYKIKPENYAAFSKEYQELLNSEIDIDTGKIEIKSDIQIDAASVLALSDVVEFAE